MAPVWKYLAGLTFGVSFSMNIQRHQYSRIVPNEVEARCGICTYNEYVNDIYHIFIAHNYRKAMQTCKIYNYYFIFATEKTKAIKSKKTKV